MLHVHDKPLRYFLFLALWRQGFPENLFQSRSWRCLECGAHTVPYIEVRNPTAQMGHEATTSKVNDDQIFYLQQRGIDMEEANYMIINGFCRGIFKELPFEFAAEASQLLRVSLEGTVG